MSNEDILQCIAFALNLIAFILCMIVAVVCILFGEIHLAIMLIALGNYNLYWAVRG